MPATTIGGYHLALFMRLASINQQFRNMLVKSETGIGDQHVIPTSLVVPAGTTADAPPPWMRATVGTPYLSPVPGVQGVVQFNLPLAGGTLSLPGEAPFDLAPISQAGQPPKPITLCWQVNLKKAGLKAAKPLAPKPVLSQLQSIDQANVFSVEVLFLDFENATFIDSVSVVPDKISSSLGLSMKLQEVLNWYVADLAKPGNNPYVLGYGLQQGDAPPPVDSGPFTPQSVDFTLTTDKSQIPVPTLDYWVVTKGAAEPPPQDRARFGHLTFDPGEDGLMVLDGDLFVRPLLKQVAAAVGISENSLVPRGVGWGNGATFDRNSPDYNCVNVQLNPRGNAVDIVFTVDVKKTDTKHVSDIIGSVFSESPTLFGWNPFHHIPDPFHHIPDPFHHLPSPHHIISGLDPKVTYWATSHWTRTDTVTFNCDASGAISASYAKGQYHQKNSHHSNGAGSFVHKIEKFLSDLANGLTKGLNWVFHNTGIPVDIPSVDLSPGVSTGGFQTPAGVHTRVPFLMPSGGVLIPSNVRFNSHRQLAVDVRYNASAS